MIHRRKRFVPESTIRRRMDEQDVRRERELRQRQPALFTPEVVPVVEVEIVRMPVEGPAHIIEITLEPSQRVATRCPDGGEQ